MPNPVHLLPSKIMETSTTLPGGHAGLSRQSLERIWPAVGLVQSKLYLIP